MNQSEARGCREQSLLGCTLGWCSLGLSAVIIWFLTWITTMPFSDHTGSPVIVDVTETPPQAELILKMWLPRVSDFAKEHKVSSKESQAFLDLMLQARSGKLISWSSQTRAAVAYVILLHHLSVSDGEKKSAELEEEVLNVSRRWMRSPALTSDMKIVFAIPLLSSENIDHVQEAIHTLQSLDSKLAKLLIERGERHLQALS